MITREQALRVSLGGPTREAQDRPDQAHGDAGGPLDGLHPGGRRALPRDRARPGRGLPVHGQGESGRGRQQRHRRARARQPRPAGGKTRHGRQGGALQALRRHRRLRHRDRQRGHRRDRPHRPADLADLRRHQPRGHPGAGVLRDRAPADRIARHPGLPRRPARHRDHLGRRADQRAADHGPRTSRRPAWSSAARAPPASAARGSTATSACAPRTCSCATPAACSTRGAAAGVNREKAEFLRETPARTLADALRGADVFVGRLAGRPADAGDGEEHGAAAGDLRDGESRPRDHAGRRAPGAQRRDRGDRALGLPEPGEQRARLPVHLPRRARRARLRASTRR